jgi:hypothetical protein
MKRGGYHFADVRTVAELAGLGIDVAELREADLAIRGSPPACYRSRPLPQPWLTSSIAGRLRGQP